MTNVQGHKVKYSNRNNPAPAAYCSISLKFGMGYLVFCITTSQAIQYESSRSKVKVTAWGKVLAVKTL